MINNGDENKALAINKEMRHNSISFDERINKGSDAVLRIKNIADIENRFAGTLYVTIFIDYNENGIVERNEIENISIVINKSRNTVLLL
ncbi:MAG: hypothetical protein LBD37_03340 [Treponema sp.]|nr:hypothetical protein [Treponema sp.]